MESTKIDHPTAGMATGYDREIGDLPVVRDQHGEFYSRWKASWRERFRILFTGIVWVGVVAERQPPTILIAGEHPAPDTFRHPWTHDKDCAECQPNAPAKRPASEASDA
jgi:hypothetical protein